MPPEVTNLLAGTSILKGWAFFLGIMWNITMAVEVGILAITVEAHSCILGDTF